MRHLNIAKLHAAKLETDPFEYIVVPAFLSQASLKQINATYPEIGKGGSYPIEFAQAQHGDQRGHRRTRWSRI